jgi:3-mercaptopyruvate sulfurtransferase SseA
VGVATGINRAFLLSASNGSHIDGARSMPAAEVVDENGFMKPKEEIRKSEQKRIGTYLK